MPFDAIEDWPAPGLSVREIVMPKGVTEANAAIRHCLTLHMGEAVRVDCQCDGLRYRGVQSSGLFDIAPAGARTRWEGEAPARVIVVRVSPSLLEASACALGLDRTPLSLVPHFQVSDPPLAHVVCALAHLSDGWPAEAHLLEGLTGALCSRLVSRYAVLGQVAVRPQQLSLRQRKRVIDYIEANLGEPVTLCRAAGVAGVSVSHFKVLFKRSMGLPLHKYIVEKRVARAVELIRQGAMPMSEIAIAAGFAHQSHMARTIRQSLGVTPSMLARELRAG
jgi:AraC family transcriptional regulator